MQALTGRASAAVARLPATPAGFWLLLALALLTKIAIILVLNDKPPNADGIRYLRAAQEMAAGNFSLSLSIYPMPAYPLLLWMSHSLTGDWMLAARALSVLALTGAAGLLYLISHELFDRRAAFWAMLAFLVAPMQNEMAALVYRGPLYLGVFAAAVWLMSRALRDPSVMRIVVAALVGMMAAMFRIEGVFLTPLFLGVLLAQAWCRPAQRRALLFAFGICLAILVGLAAAVLGGQPDGVNGYGRLEDVWRYLADLVSGDAWQDYQRVRDGLEAIEDSAVFPSQDANFGEIALRYVWLVYLIGLTELLFEVLHPVFVVPLAFGLRRPWPSAGGWLITVFVAYGLVLYVALFMTDFSNARFVLAASFLLYPWVGNGVVRLLAWLESRSRWWLALVALMLAVPMAASLGTLEVEDESAVAAGRWLAQSPYREVPVIGNDPRIAFAAGIPLYGPSDRYAHYRPKNRDYAGIEAQAETQDRPLIFLKLRKTRLERMPTLARYREIQRFDDGEKIVFVFVDPRYQALPKVRR